MVRCFRSATLSELASRTAITWPVPIAHCVALLLVRKEAGAVVRCFRSATLFELASRTAITWPVPIAHCVALLLVSKEAGAIFLFTLSIYFIFLYNIH